jgi:hypothetical protein
MTLGSLLSGLLDGANDSRIGSATADVAIHVADDVFPARALVDCKESCGLHDLTGLAVATLWNLQRDPGLLERMVALSG